MADKFETGVCSGNWWSCARNMSTPCSTTLSDVGGFGWPNEISIDMKARSREDSVSCNSMVYQNSQRPQESDSIGGGGGLMDSTLQMMSYSLSSPTTTEWNQALVNRTSGRLSEINLGSSHDGEKDWSPKNFSDGGEDPSINPFKLFVFEQHDLDCKVNYSSPIVSASTLLPGLFEPDHQPPYCMLNYSSPMNYHMDLNEMSPSIPQFIKTTSPKSQTSTNQLHFSNNTPFWNASADSRSQYSSCSNLTGKLNNEEVRDSSSVMKQSIETTFKRPRIETPSPLPTFKVRKEKLGDRVTALQQLVSPFGKTDTASVLFEAIEYIKFLHGQLGVLSTPYKKNGATMQYQENSDESKDTERGLKQDLKSRGLCLVPVSSTFPVTNETTSDFWTPTFGGSYR